MADTRHKNEDWIIETNLNGTVPSDDAHLAVLMDIRDELQHINRVLHCPRFQLIPHKLDAIRRNTMKKRKPKRP